MIGHKKTILLSFDLEEFDLQLEYGINFPLAEQMAVAKEAVVVFSSLGIC